MSVSIPEDIQGLDQASAELDRMIAADAAADAAGGQTAPVQTRESANAAAQAARQRAAQPGDPNAPPDTEKKTVPDPSPKTEAEQAAEAAKAGEKPPEKSRYQKAVERQEKSWTELNAQKDALKREREDFDRAKAEHQTARAEAEKEFSPEAYDSAAKKFEEAGKFDLADLAREKAKALRENPQPKTGPKPDALEPQRKEWALKAGVDFPEVARTNSPLQVRVAQLLKEEPDLKAHPKGIYMAARLADLEQQAAASGSLKAAAAVKDKELDTLRAKVKELEGLTSPGGGGAQALPQSKRFEELSDDEQFAQLQREAQEVGALR